MVLALSFLHLKAKIFKKAKTIKTVTKYIIGDTAQFMGEHTEKQFIYLRQKQGRNTHWKERIWVSSLMKRCKGAVKR